MKRLCILAVPFLAACVAQAPAQAPTIKYVPSISYNPYTGNQVVKGGVYNPYTGSGVSYKQTTNSMTGVQREGVSGYNGLTNNYTRATESHNPWTGTTRGAYVRR